MLINPIRIVLFLISMAILLVSCSDPNQDAPLAGSYHERDWVLDHGDFATADPFACTSCHGTDYNGGGTVPGCFTCHYDGPPFTIHPSSWIDAYDDHRIFVPVNGIASCSLAACHGTQPFISGGLSGPSCGTASYTDRDGNLLTCHDGHVTGAIWLLPSAHAAMAISDITACLVCHEKTGAGPFATIACLDCHTTDPMIFSNCSSCHNNPPNGTAFPNRDGEHDKHVNDKGIACEECHKGFGTDTLGHWYPNPADPADIQFGSTINIIFDGSNCTSDCHGEDHNDSW